MSNSAQVAKLYHTVVEDVITNVKDAFLDEGVDEQVLLELKQLWEGKLAASKALEPPPSDNEVLFSHGVLPQSVQGAQAQQINLAQHQRQAQATQQLQSNQQFQPSAAAATARLALPSGLFPQQVATLSAGGQIHNITVQQTGTGQYITLAGLTPQLSQMQQHQQQQQQQQQRLAPNLAPQMLQQQQGQQHIQIAQQQQPPKLIHGSQLLQQAQAGHSSQAQGLHNIVQIDGSGDLSSSDDDNDSDDGRVTIVFEARPKNIVKKSKKKKKKIVQIDGLGDTSSSDDDDDLEDDKEEEEEKEEEAEEIGEEEEPLNSADDVSEEDPNELFDTDNVVVCQYDKINRNKNKWKFYLKDGIMSLNGRDFVFHKATGDSEW